MDFTDQHDNTRRRQWFLGGITCFCLLIAVGVIVAGLLLQNVSSADLEYTQAQLLEKTLGVAHDELIMLIISLVVLVQVVANYRFLQRLPWRSLILCSFTLLALSAFCTVAESLVFEEVLNYIEHLSSMVAAVLLAVWCWCVFGSKKQEGS